MVLVAALQQLQDYFIQSSAASTFVCALGKVGFFECRALVEPLKTNINI